eukprot:2576718-Prymnesium_polylepis.1
MRLCLVACLHVPLLRAQSCAACVREGIARSGVGVWMIRGNGLAARAVDVEAEPRREKRMAKPSGHLAVWTRCRAGRPWLGRGGAHGSLRAGRRDAHSAHVRTRHVARPHVREMLW